MADAGTQASMRLDCFLWFARIVRTRAAGQAMATSGRLRLDGRPIDRAAAPVRVGNVLTFAIPGALPGGGVRAIRVEALPPRRGPAPEARACYIDLLVRAAPPAAASIGEADCAANVSQAATLD